jgi:hypothetical protein
MIVSNSEVDELENQLENHFGEEVRANSGDYFHEEFPGTGYIYRNPHLVLAMGFDEYRLIESGHDEAQEIERLFPDVWGMSFPLDYEALYRTESSGDWRLFQGLKFNADRSGLDLSFTGARQWESVAVSCREWVARLRKLVAAPREDSSILSLSKFWLPRESVISESPIAGSTKEIIQSIHKGYESLRQIHWRELEELVAELLKAKGMQVHLTKKTGDGGRDIIARGELISGEPMTIAVEVKNKDVVGIEDARQALWANRDFPALMLVTSGVFSAGVIEEKRNNSLRLFLKDGVALQQWIHSYCEISPYSSLRI